MRKLLLSLLVLLGVASPTCLTQAAMSIDTLKATYESSRRQIEGDALTAYSNGLTVAATGMKQAGDVDGYITLQAEQKRLAVDKTFDPAVTNGNRTISEAALRVMAFRDARMVGLLKAYMAKLDGTVKQLLMADRIEEARAVKDTMEAAKFALADLESRRTGSADEATRSADPTPKASGSDTVKAIRGNRTTQKDGGWKNVTADMVGGGRDRRRLRAEDSACRDNRVLQAAHRDRVCL